MEDYSIRLAKMDDMEFIINLAKNEGWNPGINDARCFYAADNYGFFIGELKGKPIGCISAVKYEDFGFVGLYIVLPEFRGMHYGLKLWQVAMENLKDVNVALDGVVLQQVNYQKSGFVYAHRNKRYEFMGRINLETDSSNIFIPDANEFSELFDYDCLHFPAPRKNFLKEWILHNKSFIYKKNNEIKGFICIRECFNGYKIGPLYAENFAIADRLYQLACSNCINKPVYLDIIEDNDMGNQLVEKYKMKFVFETARMYTKGIPNINWKEVVGITSFELG